MDDDRQGVLPGMERSKPREITPEEARDDAIARVRRGADDWVDEALLILRQVCRQRRVLTTDDVHAEADAVGLRRPREPRAWGAVMRAGIDNKWLVKMGGYQKSRRKKCHARPIPLYHSLIYPHFDDDVPPSEMTVGGARYDSHIDAEW